MFMTRPDLGALVLSCALAVLPGLVAPSPLLAQAMERDLIVSAIDASGAPVEALGPQDVVVREDGAAREVLRVRRATEPMQIALLVDNSEAATQPIKDIRDAILAFTARMADG